MVLAALLLGPATAWGQSAGRVRLAATVGARHFALRQVRENYAQARSYFDRQIPVETQREFPPNVVLGAELVVRVSGSLTMGVAADYTWTSAYTLYSDATGEFDLETSVHVTTVQSVLAFGPEPLGRFRPHMDLRVGVGFCSYSEGAEVRLAPPLDRRMTDFFSGSRAGLAAEPAFGMDYAPGGLELGAAIGYRWFSVSAIRGQRTANGAAYPDDLDFRVDASGLLLRLRVGWSF